MTRKLAGRGGGHNGRDGPSSLCATSLALLIDAGRFWPMIVAPPFALEAPRFRFPALAACAARAPLGGGREAAVAVLMVARLASGHLAPHALTAPVRTARAAAARTWFASLTLPTAVRAPILRAIDASGGDAVGLRDALATVMQVTQGQLDRATHAELQALLRALALT